MSFSGSWLMNRNRVKMVKKEYGERQGFSGPASSGNDMTSLNSVPIS
jgi:hypothetical protein